MQNKLPGLLGEIAEVTDIGVAMAIAEQVGGTRVTIPARAPDGHWLVELVGRDAANKICDHFRTLSPEDRETGARHVIIPRGPAGCLAKAQRRLVKELEAGTSAREAARRAGLSERSAWRMRARLRDEDDSQGKLF
jgi:DNA-binding CsgD family transcriptional regulator